MRTRSLFPVLICGLIAAWTATAAARQTPQGLTGAVLTPTADCLSVQTVRIGLWGADTGTGDELALTAAIGVARNMEFSIASHLGDADGWSMGVKFRLFERLPIGNISPAVAVGGWLTNGENAGVFDRDSATLFVVASQHGTNSTVSGGYFHQRMDDTSSRDDGSFLSARLRPHPNIVLQGELIYLNDETTSSAGAELIIGPAWRLTATYTNQEQAGTDWWAFSALYTMPFRD